MIKVCKQCGLENTNTRKNSNYCSQKCRLDRNNDNALNNYYKKYQVERVAERAEKLFEKVCEICSNKYMTYKHNRMFCSMECYTESCSRRAKNDPATILKRCNRDRIRDLVRQKIMNKTLPSSIDYFGADGKTVVAHIESKFVSGMSWHNKNLWHVDHIIPLTAFNLLDETECKKAFHYTNLQPLWAEDNWAKSSWHDGQFLHIERTKQRVLNQKSSSRAPAD